MLQSSASPVNPIREGAVNTHFNYLMKKGGLLARDEWKILTDKWIIPDSFVWHTWNTFSYFLPSFFVSSFLSLFLFRSFIHSVSLSFVTFTFILSLLHSFVLSLFFISCLFLPFSKLAHRSQRQNAWKWNLRSSLRSQNPLTFIKYLNCAQDDACQRYSLVRKPA